MRHTRNKTCNQVYNVKMSSLVMIEPDCYWSGWKITKPKAQIRHNQVTLLTLVDASAP